MAKLNSIQGLRGLAAISVVLSHLEFFRMGAYGVDLFFIISGFIITYVTKNNIDKFLTKRIIRIVPLYWLMTVFISIIALILPTMLNSTTFNFTYFIKSLFFIPFDKNGYVEPLLALGWTLNYEIFFYFIFWISALITHKFRSYLAFFILTTLSLLGKVIDFNSVIFDFYSSTILLEFGFGMLLAEFFMIRNFTNNISRFKYLILIALLLFLFISPGKELGELRFATWGLGSALLFFLVVIYYNNLYLGSFLNWIGKISYSLYLTHIFVILGINRLIFDLSYFSFYSVIISIISLIISMIVAYVSWYIIEFKLTNYLRTKTGVEKVIADAR